jgi:hypothetical protein
MLAFRWWRKGLKISGYHHQRELDWVQATGVQHAQGAEAEQQVFCSAIFSLCYIWVVIVVAFHRTRHPQYFLCIVIVIRIEITNLSCGDYTYM